MSRFSVETIFKGIDQVTGVLRKIAVSSGITSKKLSADFKAVDQRMGMVHRGVMRTTRVLTGVGFAGGVAAAAILKTGTAFEDSLIDAATKFPGKIEEGTKAFELLSDSARKVGADTEFTASEAAQGLDFLAMAGFNSTQAMGALPGVVDLATAKSMDLARATDVTSDSLGAFNLMSKDSVQLGKNLARVNDVITKTTNSANTSVDLMFESMKAGGPVATASGQDIETFAALTGKLADAGIKGSESGTALRNVFLRLQAPAAAGARALKDLGVQVEEGGKMRDIVDIIGDLERSTKKLGGVEATEKLTDIFGARAITSVQVLLQKGQVEIEKYRSEIRAAGGISKDVADTMRTKTSAAVKSLGSAVESLGLDLFEHIREPFRHIVIESTAWLRANRKLIASGFADFLQKLKDNLPEIVMWLKRIGIALAVFYSLRLAIWAAQAALLAYNTAAALVNGTMTVYNAVFASGAAKTAALTLASWAGRAAQVAYNVAIAIGNAAFARLTLAQIAAKAAQLASAAATWAVTTAQGAYNVALATGAGGLAAFKVAALASVSATWAAMVPLAPFAAAVGLAAAAVGSLILAWKQWEALDAQTGSLGIGGTLEKMVEMGTLDPFEAIDAHMNEEARAAGPQERAALAMNTTSRAELTIRDQTGRAEVTRKPTSPNLGLNVLATGTL